MPRLHLQHMHAQCIVVYKGNIQKATCGMGPPRRSMYNGSTGKEHDIRKNWACAKGPLKGVPYVSARQLIDAEQGLRPFIHLTYSDFDTFTGPHLLPALTEGIAVLYRLWAAEYARASLPGKCQGQSHGAHDACCRLFKVSQVLPAVRADRDALKTLDLAEWKLQCLHQKAQGAPGQHQG